MYIEFEVDFNTCTSNVYVGLMEKHTLEINGRGFVNEWTYGGTRQASYSKKLIL